MKTTDLRRILSVQLVALMALGVWTSTAKAQQPFGDLPATQEAPQEEAENKLPTEPPIQVRPRGDRFLGQSQVLPRDNESKSDQPILINSKYAGWEGADANKTEGKLVGEALRGNWIMIDDNGKFTGRVTPSAGADVENMKIFLMHMGRLVKQVPVSEDGQFAFTNVRPAAYSVVGWGTNGFFSFGVNILEYNPENEGKLPTTLNPIAFQNKSTINTDWIQYFAARVNFRVYGRYPTGEGRDDPQQLYGLIGLYNYLPSAEPANSISGQPVSTQNGRLVGRVHQFNSINGRPVDVRSTKVMLLENDSQVAVTSTDNYGVFVFENVPNGSYGVLAAGVDGVGLIGIDVSDAAAVNADGNVMAQPGSAIDFTMISSETIGWLNDNARKVAFQRALNAPRPPAPVNPYAAGCATCNNQMGGCNDCQQKYLESMCRSRGITFEQWQAMGCQCVKSGFGSGHFAREASKALRQRIEKVDAFYEGIFYPSSSLNEALSGGRANPNGYGQPGFQGGYGAPVYGTAPRMAPAPAMSPAPRMGN